MSKTSPKLKILYCESDPEVLASQSAGMATAGHHVQNAEGRAPAQEALRRGTFDLVILGATLSKNDRHHLPYMVKKAHKTTKVLVAHTGGHHHEVDATADGEKGVAALLDKISLLFGAPASAKVQTAAAGR